MLIPFLLTCNFLISTEGQSSGHRSARTFALMTAKTMRSVCLPWIARVTKAALLVTVRGVVFAVDILNHLWEPHEVECAWFACNVVYSFWCEAAPLRRRCHKLVFIKTTHDHFSLATHLFCGCCSPAVGNFLFFFFFSPSVCFDHTTLERFECCVESVEELKIKITFCAWRRLSSR